MKQCMKCWPKMCHCPLTKEEKRLALVMYYRTFKKVLTIEEVNNLKEEMRELESK